MKPSVLSVFCRNRKVGSEAKMRIMRLINKLIQGSEKLGRWVRRAIARISTSMSSSVRLRHTDVTNLMVGVTSIVALSVVIIAIFSPCFSNPNMYFWVYSTIIQAFAAMIALVAIFLIYRLEMLKREEQFILERLKNNLVSATLSLEINQTGQRITPQWEEKERRKLERLPRYKVLQQAKLMLCELQKKISGGGLRGGDLATPEDMKDRINTDLQEIKRRNEYRDALVSSTKSPLILVGILISLSLILLPFSPGATNSYARVPLSFLLTVVLGLSIITLFKIIRAIMRILKIEKNADWKK